MAVKCVGAKYEIKRYMCSTNRLLWYDLINCWDEFWTSRLSSQGMLVWHYIFAHYKWVTYHEPTNLQFNVTTVIYWFPVKLLSLDFVRLFTRGFAGSVERGSGVSGFDTSLSVQRRQICGLRNDLITLLVFVYYFPKNITVINFILYLYNKLSFITFRINNVNRYMPTLSY